MPCRIIYVCCCDHDRFFFVSTFLKVRIPTGLSAIGHQDIHTLSVAIAKFWKHIIFCDAGSISATIIDKNLNMYLLTTLRVCVV